MGSGGSRSIITSNTRERAYGGGRESFRRNLEEYQNQYYLHVGKIKADPYNFDAILGWVNQCRHFADKAYEIGSKLLKDGATVELSDGGASTVRADQAMLRSLYEKRLAELDAFERNASR